MKRDYNNKLLLERRRKLRESTTNAETVLWNAIRNKQLNGLKFWRQYSVGPYILDFYCPKLRLVIELDGAHHANTKTKNSDQERTLNLESLNIHVLRFWNHEVLSNLTEILKTIAQYAKEVPPLRARAT